MNNISNIHGRKRVFDIHPSYAWAKPSFMRYPRSFAKEGGILPPFLGLESGLLTVNPSLKFSQSVNIDHMWLKLVKSVRGYRGEFAKIWGCRALAVS